MIRERRKQTMDWTRWFDEIILERGWQYYEDGHIIEYTVDDDVIEATIEGTRDYHVSLDVSVPYFRFDCSCPHASDGYHCKHMAALGYFWENSEERLARATKKAESDEQKLIEIEQLIKETPPEFIHQYLLERLSNNQELLRYWKLQVRPGIDQATLKFYQAKADQLIRRITQYYAFYDYDFYSDYDDDDSEDFYRTKSDLADFLSYDIGLVLDRGEFELPLCWTANIYRALMKAAYEQGNYFDVEEHLLDAWQALYDKADDKKRSLLFDRLEDIVLDEGQGIAADFLFDTFDSTECLDRRLQLAQQCLPLQVESSGPLMSGGYWPIRVAELMEEDDRESKEIEGFLISYQHIPEVRVYLARYLARLDRLSSAIELLKEGRARGRHDQKIMFQREIVKTYQAAGREIDYRSELYEMVKSYTTNELGPWRELRQLYPPDKWLKVRQKLIDQWPEDTNRLNIYEEEAMNAELLEAVLDGSGWLLSRYESILKPLYPEELLDYLTKSLKSMPEHPTNRKNYRRVAAGLHHLREYPGGDEAVAELISYWRTKYPKRPALWEELRSFGPF
ncbi:MAG TPA: hypothetical protein GXZ74_03805 [Tissierellia bacterium]|nr:hypothetical protein [Tissierellia bacterium]